MIVNERCLFILIIGCLKSVNSYQLSSVLRCSQEPGVVGGCLQNQTKWTFVKKFGCYSFQYSGCGGNQNNFLNKHECFKVCTEEDNSLASEGLSTSLIRGGIKVTDPTHYPWFAFLRIGLPDIEWIIVDPKTGTGRIEEMDETNPYMWTCSGILVTLSHVLTADHCLWAQKPKYWAINKQGESYKYMQFIEFYKNVVDDTSIRFRKTTRRGSLDNIAVKLYGTTYSNAHPTKRDAIDTNTMFHPWFESETTSTAFSVKNYDAIAGGVNGGGSGKWKSSSVDIAVLTVDTTEFFKELGFPMEFHLTRLKWVEEERDKLQESTTNIYQLGAGRTGPGDCDINYPLMQLHLSKKKFRFRNHKHCLKNDPKIYWLNQRWSICIKETDNVGSECGDSGGPGLRKDKSGPKEKDKAVYFLHYLTSRKLGKMGVAANLEQKKDIVFPPSQAGCV